MPSAETLQRYREMVERNLHDEAAQQFYAEGAVARENQGPPRSGRATQVAREQEVLARAAHVKSTCIEPVFVAGDRVVFRWVFEFRWKDGSVTRMEELAYQTWKGEQIVEEQFFYDPAQRTPKWE
jgi:hypothetical protein